MEKPKLLVINPGSTSTKLALFEGETCKYQASIQCPGEQLAQCPTISDQIHLREQQVLRFLTDHGIVISSLSAIAARGGPLLPVAGGVYQVNDTMLADAQSDRFIEHVSRIACVIAALIGHPHEIPVYIVDPVSTDEFDEISRISGLREIPRHSLTHALNMKAVSREYAKQVEMSYNDLNLITVQLGGGTSLAIHSKGRMIDAVDSNGEGPFSPERSGGLRVDDFAAHIATNDLSVTQIRQFLTREGGLMSHLGTADAPEVESRIQAGDSGAELVYQAMAYATSKHICSLAAAVNGSVDAIILTGGLANSKMLTGWIIERVSFLAPVTIIPGEREMLALAQGALRVLTGDENVKEYGTQTG